MTSALIAHAPQDAHRHDDCHANGDRRPDEDFHPVGATPLIARIPKKSATRSLHEEHHHGKREADGEHHPGDGVDAPPRRDRPSHRRGATRPGGLTIATPRPTQYPMPPRSPSAQVVVGFFPHLGGSCHGFSWPADEA